MNTSTNKFDENSELTKAEMVKWEREFNIKSGEEEAWEVNNARIFNLLLLHCSPEFRSRLQGKKDWSTTEDKQNGIVLLD